MKLFLTLLLALIVPAQAFGQESVTRISSTSIDKDAVWSGKVVIEHPLKVSKGATLTIKPGTEARFMKGAGLSVEGVLKAVGKKGSPIAFTSAEAAPAPGDWTGISFSESGDGTALKRCVISYAAALSIAACSPPIRNCELTHGQQGVVLARKAESELADNTITEMTGGGVNCQMGSAPVISGNTLERCGPFGVYAGQDSQPVIKGNTIKGCENGISISQQVVPPIEGNTLKGNRVGLILTTVGDSQVVRGNRVTESETGILCQQFSNPLIEKNEITGNKEGIVCFRASSPMIRSNEVSGNEKGVICVQLCNPKITANNIYDNKKGIYLDLSAYAVINGNNIYDNELQVELGNMSSDWEYRVNNKPDRGNQARNLAMASRGRAAVQQMADGAHIMGYVDATGNWWGETTTAEMEDKGADANIKQFTDYYDVPTRTYEGYSGIYIQDKIKYEGWKKVRIKSAGI